MTRHSEQHGSIERAAVPIAVSDLAGVWRRDLLVTPDGRRDAASDVYWLQSQTICGDIRREPGGSAQSPPMTAFAGRLSERDGIFRWERTLASFPLDGPADDGRLSWQGDVLREDGVHAPYWEIWGRVALPSPGDYAAELVDPSDGRLGYLLSIGGFAFFAKGASPINRQDGPAFSLSAIDPQGRRLNLSAPEHFAPGWNETAPPAMPDDTVRIPEWDGDGETRFRDWSVAALERPHVLAKRF